MEKIQAWGLLAVISVFEVAVLYMGYNGAIQGVVIPLATYLMGIITKTAVDKVKNNNSNSK